MKGETSVEQSRGRRNPTSVWIRKRKGATGANYGIRWIDPRTGKEVMEACGHDLALARQRRDAKKSELRVGMSGRLPDKRLCDLKEAMGGFMAAKAADTLRETRLSIQRIIDLCGDVRLEHVDRALVLDFRGRRLASGASIATVNKDLRQVKSALTYATDAGWIRTNPLWRWKAMLMKEPEKRIRVVEVEDFAKLTADAVCPDPVFRALIIVAYFQGLRRTELVNLRWDAVDLDKGVLHVENRPEHSELTKSRKNRRLPMMPVVRENLAKMHADAAKVVEGGTARPKYPHVFTWGDGRPFGSDWVSHRFAKLVKDSGIDHASIHDRVSATLS